MDRLSRLEKEMAILKVRAAELNNENVSEEDKEYIKRVYGLRVIRGGKG
jgi:hypothetical protein